jgi:hypothetical protein
MSSAGQIQLVTDQLTGRLRWVEITGAGPLENRRETIRCVVDDLGDGFVKGRLPPLIRADGPACRRAGGR